MGYVYFDLNRQRGKAGRKRVDIVKEFSEDFKTNVEISFKDFDSLTTGLATKLTTILRGRLSKMTKYVYTASGDLSGKEHLVKKNKKSAVKRYEDDKEQLFEYKIEFSYDFPEHRGFPYAFALNDPDSKWKMNHASLVKWLFDKIRHGESFTYYNKGKAEPVTSENIDRLAYVMQNYMFTGRAKNIVNSAENWINLSDSDPKIQGRIKQLQNLFKKSVENKF